MGIPSMPGDLSFSIWFIACLFVCFRMDVFNFQYPLPEIFDFLISKVLKLHDQKGCWGLLRCFGLFEFC